VILNVPWEVIYQKDPLPGVPARVSVALTCFRYGDEAREALDSLLEQTEQTFDVIVVDDCSPDGSVLKIANWFAAHESDEKLRSISFCRHMGNHGLSQSRNTALSLISTKYVFILDADNMIYPRALQVLADALERSGEAMAYSLIERFGAETGIVNNSLWIPEKFSYGNYIDAMAMIRMDVLREIGGYRIMPDNFGWEDYDLWCSLVDRQLRGCHVPEILCRYRTQPTSMVNQRTNPYFAKHGDEVRRFLRYHHTIPIKF
jgi:glycosyltransferase involved in cell wall biosynthesis